MSAVEALGEYISGLTPEQLDDARDYIATLPRAAVEQWERIVAEQLAAGWRRNPLAMGLHLRDPSSGDAPVRVSGDPIQEWRHVELLADAFRRCRRGESRFQLWEVPSQMQKSTTLRLGIVWALDDDPTLPIIYTSYANDLAREGAIFARDVAEANAEDLRFTLRRDVKRADRWQTEQGGGLLARGLSAGISGYPAGLALIDDPFKNWQEAHRPLQRDTVWGHVTGVVRLRLRQGGGAIVAHARVHTDDTAGRLRKLAHEEGFKLEVISLPMLAEPTTDEYGPDPLGRAVGEPIEPRRYDEAECRSRAIFLGSYLASALEQQRPRPEEGGEVLREWWRWTATPPLRMTELASSWDMKLKDKEAGDYVVGLVGGRIGGDFWIIDMIRGQFSQLQTKIAIALMYVRHPETQRHYIENTGNGPEVMAELRRGDPTFELTVEQADKVGVREDERAAVQAIMRRGLSGLIAVNVKGSKVVRARTVVPLIEAGNVHLIERTQWAHALVDEWAAFPPKQGGHDDIVDATSQLLSRLSKGRGRIREAPPTQVPTPDPGARALPQGPASVVPARARILS